VDNLAHTLIGIGVARSGLSRRFGPGTTATLAIASNLPDLDALYTIIDPWDRFMLRRTHTHALIALPLLAAALTFLLQRRYRERPWGVGFGLSLLGVVLHVLFDLVNSFGVVVLWPFSPHRFELESVFIIDLVIWGLMAGAMLTARFLKSEDAKRRTYQIAVAALGVYVVLCLAAHARAEAQLRETLARENLHPRALRIFPEPLGPQRFRAAVLVDGAWNVYLCHLLRGTSELRGRFPTDEATPRVAELRATPKGRALDRFMAAPVWTLEPDGRVRVYDLRFRSLVIPRSPTFQVEFDPGSAEPKVR
jgi:inner membrane protein